MTAQIAIGDSDVLLIVDIQNDFCPGGALPVPLGDEIVSLVNLLAQRFQHVVLSQDWHPRGHRSFASSHPGRRPFQSIELPYGRQVLWPDHCIQGTRGAAFHAGLNVPHAELVLRKGYRPSIDSYSAFYENDRKTPTGLGGYLRERGLSRVFLAGLAFDFCVCWSAEDACKHGFHPLVIEDACRAIDVEGSAAISRNRLAAIDVPCVASSAIASP